MIRWEGRPTQDVLKGTCGGEASGVMTKPSQECKRLGHKEDAVILKYYSLPFVQQTFTGHRSCVDRHPRSVVPKRFFGLRIPSLRTRKDNC